MRNSAAAVDKNGAAMRTVHELLEVAARPVLEALPERMSVDDFYHPDFTDEEVRSFGPLSGDPADLVAEVERHTAMVGLLANTPFVEAGELTELGMRTFSVMLRGSIRAVLSGVFAAAPRTLAIHCYADGESAFAWSRHSDGCTHFRGDEFANLPMLIVDYLPDAADGVAEPVTIHADGRGVVAEGQDDRVGAVLDFLDRERAGTTLVDLVAFGGLCSEYPEHGFVIIDNDLGRHVLTCRSEGGSRRELMLAASGRTALAGWLGKSVEAGRTGL